MLMLMIMLANANTNSRIAPSRLVSRLVARLALPRLVLLEWGLFLGLLRWLNPRTSLNNGIADIIRCCHIHGHLGANEICRITSDV